MNDFPFLVLPSKRPHLKKSSGVTSSIEKRFNSSNQEEQDSSSSSDDLKTMTEVWSLLKRIIFISFYRLPDEEYRFTEINKPYFPVKWVDNDSIPVLVLSVVVDDKQ